MSSTRWPDADAVLDRLQGGLIVSCQALPGDPLNSLESLVALARSAEQGGADGVRVASPRVVAAVRQACQVPIIGITKHLDRTRAFITPTFEDARNLVDAGADLVAIDATDRARPDGRTASELIVAIRSDLGVPVLADVSTITEGQAALAAGAELVASTLAGYTAYTTAEDGPDLHLVRALAASGRVVAEGRIHSPAHVAASFAAGAFAVVVGRAITRPQDITARFAAATPRARSAGR